MKPAPFKYFAPTALEEALALLAEYGDEARPLAGGQSLVPAMNFRLARPEVLVDLNRVPELFFISEASGELRLGAMTRQRELERHALVAQHAPLLRATAPHIAHPQIRNRGTVGGSLAHADPAAELPAVMVAMGARFRLQSAANERWLAAEDFYEDVFTTTLEPGEMLVEVAVPPLPARSGWAFQEVARRHGDFALVGVAALVSLDEQERCRDARIVLLSVGGGPVQAEQAAQVLAGQKPETRLVEEAARLAAEEDIDPPDDLHASAAYRRHLARVLTRRALTEAFARAENAD